MLEKTVMAAFAATMVALAAEAKTVVVPDMPRMNGSKELFAKAAELAGLDFELRKCSISDWSKAATYVGADVLVFTGGWHDSKFNTVETRRELVKFAASGKGVLLVGFRCGPVRNGTPPIFPSIGTTYGGHPLSPWVSSVGDSAIAKAFGGKMLNFGGFDCVGLRLGPAATPFAKCSDEIVGAYGPCGLGRAVLFGGFVYGENAERRDIDGTCAVMAEILRYLASAPEATEAAKADAIAREMAALDRYNEILRLTQDNNGPTVPQGIIPAARDAVLVPVESRQLRLEHYARTLDDTGLVAQCRELAANAKPVVDEIRRTADAAISAAETGTLRDKDRDWKAEFAGIATKCDIAALDALIVKCRAKACEERAAHVAAEHKQDLLSLPSLVSRLSSADPNARLDAATELGRIGEATPEVVAALVKAIDDADDKVAVQAVISLAWMQAKGAVDALMAKVSDANCEEHVRRRAAQSLGQIGDRRAIPALMPLLASRDRWLRENAILSLGYLKATEAVPVLMKYAKGEGIPEHDGKYGRGAVETNSELVTRECAIVALGDIGDKTAVETLKNMDDVVASHNAKRKGRRERSHLFSCAGLGTGRLAKEAIARIDAGGRAVPGLRQPQDLSSRKYFYALTKGNNALAGRLYWTLPTTEVFKARENHTLLLPYLLDAGCTGFHDGWEPPWLTGEDALVDLIRECDELGLVVVEQAVSSTANDFCDVLKGSQDATFERLGDVPMYRGCWCEEWWPAVKSTGKDLDAWLRRKYGDDYRSAMGLTAVQDPFAKEVWDLDSSDGDADNDKYEPGANSGALRAAVLEKGGEDLEERWREAQDWLSCRRKAFSLTYNVTDGLMSYAVGGQKAQERIGVFGPETYQACGRGNVFMIEYCRNGIARPILTEFYSMYSPTLAHDLRGFYENAIRAKCFFPFVLPQIFPFYSSYGPWACEKRRWGEFCKVYRHVRDNRELYEVSPSATEVAVAVSERSTAAFSCRNSARATLQAASEQRGSAVYAALSMSHIYGDVIHTDVADAARLAKYKVIFLVNAKILTDAEQKLLKDWLAAGGTLVCDGAVTLFDAKDFSLRDGYAMSSLLGVKYKGTDFAPTRDVWQYGLEKGGRHPFRLRQGFDNPWRFNSFVYRDFKPSDCVVTASDGTEYDASLGIDRVELNGAKAVQTFSDGSPALTVNEYGKGRVYFFAANAPSLGYVSSQYESTPNRYAFWPGVREMYEKLAREGLARAGTEQAVDLENAPEELDLVIYSQKGGDRLVVHLLDRDESRASLDGVSLRINGSRPIKAVYRPGGKPLPLAGRTVSLGKFDVYDMVVVEFE